MCSVVTHTTLSTVEKKKRKGKEKEEKRKRERREKWVPAERDTTELQSTFCSKRTHSIVREHIL
jgi:hypothetical protein